MEINVKQLNTDALAYMGDAVYEQFVRRRLLANGMQRAHNMQKTAVKYVSAVAQAQAVRDMFEELSEEEQRLVKRARNHKYSSKAKNADPITYKWATAFEALVGHLYLIGDTARLNQIMEKAAEAVEQK